MQNLTTESTSFHLRDTRAASHMGRLAAMLPRIFRVVITTQSRGVRRSLQCGDPLTMVDGRGSVAGAKTCRSGFSLSFARSLAPFREVEDVVAYAMANSSSDQIIRVSRQCGASMAQPWDWSFDRGVNNPLFFTCNVWYIEKCSHFPLPNILMTSMARR